VDVSHVSNTHPSLALDKYAGTYSDSMYGNVTVRVENGKLALKYAKLSEAELAHWHYDTFRAMWRNRLLARSMVTFILDGNAKVASVKIENLAEFIRQPVKGDGSR
jgi:hypothetical protein